MSIALLATCTIRSRSRLFWSDELYGARVVGATSFRSMLGGWYQGADGGGIAYYLLARSWTALFGFSELTLRLFSTAGMCVSLALTWAIVRRFSSTLVVTLSVGLLYLASNTLLWQEVNGRFYGLFLASAALASLMFVVAAEAPLTPFLFVATTLAHLALVGSHILGCVYSFCLLIGLVLLEYKQRGERRWPLYLAGALGWFVLPLSYHAVRSSSAIATDVFWTRRPQPAELLWGLVTYGRLPALLVACVLLLAMACVFVRWMRGRRRTAVVPIPPSAVFLAGSLIAAQLLLFAKSQVGISVYADRYLLPVAIATALLLAASWLQILPDQVGDTKTTPARVILSLLMLLPVGAYGLTRRINHDVYPLYGYPQRLVAAIPPGAPVMATMPEFTLLSHYDPTRQYLFMLDWSYDLDPHHPAFDAWDARLMENWRRSGYEADRILPCADLFAQYPNFYILLDFQREPWFNDRLLHNPAFELHKVGDNREWVWIALWSVQRKHNGPAPC